MCTHAIVDLNVSLSSLSFCLCFAPKYIDVRSDFNHTRMILKYIHIFYDILALSLFRMHASLASPSLSAYFCLFFCSCFCCLFCFVSVLEPRVAEGLIGRNAFGGTILQHLLCVCVRTQICMSVCVCVSTLPRSLRPSLIPSVPRSLPPRPHSLTHSHSLCPTHP